MILVVRRTFALLIWQSLLATAQDPIQIKDETVRYQAPSRFIPAILLLQSMITELGSLPLDHGWEGMVERGYRRKECTVRQ